MEPPDVRRLFVAMHSSVLVSFWAWYHNVMNMDKQKTILVSVVAVVVLGAALWYYYAKKSASNIQSAATQGVLPSIGEAANPLTNKPDINPTSKTNPFDSVKTNPFE